MGILGVARGGVGGGEAVVGLPVVDGVCGVKIATGTGRGRMAWMALATRRLCDKSLSIHDSRAELTMSLWFTMNDENWDRGSPRRVRP